MNAPQVIPDKAERARRLLSDCRQHLSRGDPATAVQLLMRAVGELGESSGHSTETLRAAFAEKLSGPQDLHSLLARMEISASQSCSVGAGSQHQAARSDECSRASSQQCFELADARSATHAACFHMDTDAAAPSISVDSQSFQCPQCGGVFALVRREQHLSLWCPAAQRICASDRLDSDSDDGMVT